MLTEFWTLVICEERPDSPWTVVESPWTLVVRVPTSVEMVDRAVSVWELMLDIALVMSPERVDDRVLIWLFVFELMLDTALLM